MNKPTVSVCITTYNQERYIHDCIMSVISQSHEVSLEILVGNDTSTDRTGEIIIGLQSKYPETIKFFDNPSNLGPSENYQNLIRQAEGDFIAHLDGDDYWLPGKLLNQLKAFETDASLSAIYTNALCISDDGSFRGIFNNPQPSKFDIGYLLRSGNFLNHSSLMYKRGFRDEILSWNYSFVDYKIHLYLAGQGDIGYIGKPGVAYRVGSQTSLILHEGERVRDLYWQALTSFPKDQVSGEQLLHASADLVRRVFFRAVNIRSAKLFIMWWKIIKNHHSDQVNRLRFLATAKILAFGVSEIKRRASSALSAGATNVIYRR